MSGVIETAAVTTERGGVPRAFRPWWSPIWVVFVAFQWWLEIRRQLTEAIAAENAPLDADVAAALGAVGHLAGNAIETLFYVAFWRARGIRLSFPRLYVLLVSISVIDLLALGFARAAASHPGWVASALEPFIGFDALRGTFTAPGSGVRAAFGSVGLLSLARIAATAAIQRHATQRGFTGPLALTFAVWLAGRLANWWFVDLVRGMSPLS